MSEQYAEIIQLLEKADDLFKGMNSPREEATRLWNDGIERLAAAIWICEREEDQS